MIHHIEIYVSNLKNSKTYWTFLLSELGYELFQEWDEGFSFKYDRAYLVFVQVETDYSEAGYHRKRIGLNHIAIYAKSSEQVDSLRDAFVDQGVRLLYDDRYPYAGGPDHYALYAEDPDRIKVEIVAPKTIN